MAAQKRRCIMEGTRGRETFYKVDSRRHSSTDEDTEDASEPELFKMETQEGAKPGNGFYKSKIAALKEQLKRVKEGTDPEYLRKLQELKDLRDKRIFMAETFREYELNAAEEEHEREKSQAILECETKRAELKDNLLIDLHEKKKTFENLRSTMEITTGAYLFEPKMMVTRKLRRRNYESIPLPDKRRRSSPFYILSTLVYELDENDIEEDIKLICKGKPNTAISTGSGRLTVSAPAPSLTVATPEIVYDVKVEDGKLHYEGKSYGKNQHILVESKERGTETAVISSISHSEIIVKLLPDNAKLRIYLSHLSRGKYTLRKKNS